VCGVCVCVCVWRDVASPVPVVGAHQKGGGRQQCSTAWDD